MSQIPVLIADGQPLYRDGLARAIRQDRGMILVGECADGASALEAVRRLRPDVAILDTDLRTVGIRRILETLAIDRVGTRVVLLTADVRPEVAFDALAAGARGYLSKRVDGPVVLRAVRRVASGQAALCDELQTLVTGEIRLRHQDGAQLLTSREHDVLSLIAQGLSAPEIARRLHLSPRTVKGYIARIYERLGVRERAHAVAEAMRRGLVA
jgi:two-component system nitrate/nitrite response regulator NarL